ncbi:LuxR C-terminal-related transcriptional regulator [Oerskovia flava]|uniref:LuxR C-terminal-related transcriptional regulator n=1 Tax=Oerskovia flava TaxID=2986422 RepID=UPI00223F2964|nr:LuxR C-terminal-related transcriptional regulator [Oerskovia sp. JB1-3-2]
MHDNDDEAAGGAPAEMLRRAATLFPPAPRRLHRRRGVEHALRAGAPITTLRAPRGYGATTAVGAWARGEVRRGAPVLWVSAHGVHPASPTPHRTTPEPAARALATMIDQTMTYVVGDARSVAPTRSPQDLAAWLDDEGAVLVVDDLGPATRGLLDALDDISRRLHRGRVVAITSARRRHGLLRSDDRLAHDDRTHAAHRDGPSAVELTLDDLAVTAEEAVEAAKVMGVDLDDELAEDLTTHLAGLAGGVYGAVDDLARAAARGQDATEDLVLSAVQRQRTNALKGLPRDVVEFLLDVSVAVDFDLLDLVALTSVSRPREQLALLRDVGAVDRVMRAGGVGYALRPRLRTALVDVARRRYPGRFRDRALTAATARVARGDARGALQLELEAGDTARVDATVSRTWTQLLDGHDDHALDALRSKTTQVPPTHVPSSLVDLLGTTRAPLGLVERPTDLASGQQAAPTGGAPDALATFAAITGLRRAARREDALATARAWFATPSAEPAATALVALQASVSALEHWRLGEASGLAQRAHREALSAGLLRLAAAGAGLTALAEALGEDLRGARAWLDEAEALPRAPRWWRSVVGDVKGLVDALEAVASVDPVQAERAAESAAVRDSACTDLWFVGLHVEAGAGVLCGRPMSAVDHLRSSLARRGLVRRRGASQAPDLRRTPVIVTVDLVRLYLALGHGTTATTVKTALPPECPLRLILRARLALARGDAAVALRSATPLTSMDALPVGQRTEAHVVVAEALHASGDEEGARAELARGASFARRHGSLLAFRRSAPASLIALLEIADSATRDHLVALDHTTAPAADVEFTHLPERQLLVLQALADGKTAPEIAQAFFVSHNTVKTQVREIYRRLDVHDRASAIRRARELGLLDPINRRPPTSPR